MARVVALLASRGPAEIIHQVRQAESRDAIVADNATIAYRIDLAP
ncbi:hypothetical protein [Phytohabitans suffuscus]|nr:hypothetical protein [Phytohabitans suffuscus]